MEYKFKKVEEHGYVILEDGHTMFPDDVVRRFERLNFLEKERVVNVPEADSVQPLLDDERAVLKEIIYSLIFAYENKDADSPHSFEYEALRFAYAYTKTWDDVKKRDYIESVLKKVSAFFV